LRTLLFAELRGEVGGDDGVDGKNGRRSTSRSLATRTRNLFFHARIRHADGYSAVTNQHTMLVPYEDRARLAGGSDRVSTPHHSVTSCAIELAQTSYDGH
jgi:hypothetical protein